MPRTPSERRTGRQRLLWRTGFSWLQLHRKWAEYGSAADVTVGHHAKTQAADGGVPLPPLIMPGVSRSAHEVYPTGLIGHEREAAEAIERDVAGKAARLERSDAFERVRVDHRDSSLDAE